MITTMHATETSESIISNFIGHMVLSEDMDVVVMAVVEGMCRIFYLIKNN